MSVQRKHCSRSSQSTPSPRRFATDRVLRGLIPSTNGSPLPDTSRTRAGPSPRSAERGQPLLESDEEEEEHTDDDLRPPGIQTAVEGDVGLDHPGDQNPDERAERVPAAAAY